MEQPELEKDYVDDYHIYITSEAWKEKRKQVFELKGKVCQRCGNKKQITVHHATYKRFKNEDVETDLYVLCEPCHDLYHSQTRFIDIESTNRFIADKSKRLKVFSRIRSRRPKKNQRIIREENRIKDRRASKHIIPLDTDEELVYH